MSEAEAPAAAGEEHRSARPRPRRATAGSRLRDARDFVWTLAIAAPPAAVAALLVAKPEGLVLGLGHVGLALALSAALAVGLRASLARRLRTISAVLASYREGDFSIRARTATGDELLHDVLAELNELGETLRTHRLGEMEAWTLLRKVMGEVDVVVLAFDARGRVRLANDAAARLLGKPGAALTGEDAVALGLAELLEGAAPRVVRDASDAPSPGLYRGRHWELRRGAFRLSGEPHTLVVLSDLSAALRDNERDAWRRLIRVMGHEINNSLAPIQSISDSLRAAAERSPRPDDWADDVQQGLGVIARRAEALGRFMASYAALARLPAPRLATVDVAPLVRKVAALEQRVPIEVEPGPDAAVRADPDQLEQVLINLVKNAAEASRDSGTVRLRWRVDGQRPAIGGGPPALVSIEGGSPALVSIEGGPPLVSIEGGPPALVSIEIEDDGPGVSDTANLFVPFYTTKQGGTGIGLVLSRQIVEAHGGELALASRPGGAGAIARVRLPAA